MSEEQVCCPHCTNVINKGDTTCTHCGEAIVPLNPLIMLCLQFGIPPVIEREGKECPIAELRCRAEGIEGIYIAPGEVREIQIEGSVH